MVFFGKIFGDIFGQKGLHNRNLNYQVDEETKNKNCSGN